MKFESVRTQVSRGIHKNIFNASVKASVVAVALTLAAGVVQADSVVGPGTYTTNMTILPGTTTVQGGAIFNIAPASGVSAFSVATAADTDPLVKLVLDYSLGASANSRIQINDTAASSGNYGIFVGRQGYTGTTLIANTVLEANGVDIQQTGSGSNSYGLYVRGGKATFNNGSISTAAYGSEGIMASYGGQVDAKNTTVTTQGSSAHGLDATQAGSRITGDGLTVTTNGVSAYGLFVNSGAQADIKNSTITTNGNGATGLQTNANSVVNLTDVVILTTNTGTGPHNGIVANSGAQVTMLRGSVETRGGANVVMSSGAGTKVSMTDAYVKSSFGAGSGIYASSDSSIDFTNGRIDTLGDSAEAAVSDHSIVTIKNAVLNTAGGAATGGSITAWSFGAYGLLSYNEGQMTVSDTTVTTTGDNSGGLRIEKNSRADLTNVVIQTSGSGSNGVFIRDGGVANLINTQIKATGNDASGIAALVGTDPTAQNTVVVDGGSIYSVQGRGVLSEGAKLDVTFKNGAQASGNGIMVDAKTKVDAINGDKNALINLVANSGAILTGDIQADTNSIANLDLSDRAVLTGAARNGSVFNIGDAGVWNITADSDVQTLSNSGIISFNAPVSGAFKTLTVHGNYTGNNGLIALNTYLGDDSSGSDKLKVEGDTAGNTRLKVTNIGGAGAQTTNGIQVVQVAGASNGDFKLEGRATAGAYEYNLFKGDTTGNGGDWYLRSAPIPPTPDPAPTPNPDPIPNPQPQPDSDNHVLRPEVGAYLGNQVAAQGMFVHTLHDRLGEPQLTDIARRNGQKYIPSTWVRVVGAHTDSQAAGGHIDQDGHSMVAQIGGELAHWTQGNDRFHFGLMAGYGSSSTKAKAQDNVYKAAGEVDGYSVGLYATWFGQQAQQTGPYVDTWLQYGWFNNSVKSDYYGNESYKSDALTGSIEGGWAFMLRDKQGSQILVEPQAQVIYTSYSANDHRDGGGSVIQTDDNGGVTTRLGARLFGRNVLESGRIWQPFVELNWWHGTGSNSIAFTAADSIGGTTLASDAPQNRYEVKMGAQAEIAKRWNLWGHVGYQTGENSYSRVEGLVGAKYIW